MSRSPLGKVPAVTSILTIPGLSRTGQGAPAILVGIVIDDSDIAWGSCEDFFVDGNPDPPLPFVVEKGIRTIQDQVVPILVGQGLSNFRPLDAAIESIRETVTILKPLPQPKKELPGISRRAIITGFLSTAEKDTSAASTEEIMIERPLHPALRHGLSQAILSAVSKVRGMTTAEVICQEFNLPIPKTAVPLQMPIRRGQTLLIQDQVAVLAYAINGKGPEELLGSNGEKIQRFVRQLRERLVKSDQHDQITIHLDARGSLGKLYDNEAGKILGALYGLEQAASPCSIRVQDPIIMDDRDAQIKALGQLRDYLRMRQMALQLVAGAKIVSLADVQAFVDHQCAHKLHLTMPHFGTVREVMEASQICQQADIGIVMAGVPSAIISQVALAMQPDALTYPPDWPADAAIATYQNEMTRTLSWFAHKRVQ